MNKAYWRSVNYDPLRVVAIDALNGCGLTAKCMHFVSDSDNVIFQVETAQRPYCVRIYPEQAFTAAEIVGELQWLVALTEQTDLDVPQPQATLTGEFLQLIDAADGRQYQVVVFGWLTGKVIKQPLTADVVQMMGFNMAKLHTHAANFQLTGGAMRDDADWYGMSALRVGLAERQIKRIESWLTAEQLMLCDKVAADVAEGIKHASLNNGFGLIHSDLDSGNCLLDNGRLQIIDFADCQVAPFSADIANTFVSFDHASHVTELRQAFIRGYRQLRPWPKQYEIDIEIFMMERWLRLIRWVSTWSSIDQLANGPALIKLALNRTHQYLDRRDI